jgi:hypothetical protein
MGAAFEVLLAQAIQHAAPELRVAADAVMGVGLELVGIRFEPALLGAIALFDPDHAGIPVVGMARKRLAALDDENAPAGGRERARHGAAARPGADDDDVEVLGLH